MSNFEERIVGGLGCFAVLDLLSEYLDGNCDPGSRARIEQHLRGCERCETFGNAFGAVMTSFRRELQQPESLEAERDDRLLQRLREAGM